MPLVSAQELEQNKPLESALELDEVGPLPQHILYPMPKLRLPHKVAAVKWHQNHSVIYLSIDTPDIQHYYLHVTPRVLDFE